MSHPSNRRALLASLAALAFTGLATLGIATAQPAPQWGKPEMPAAPSALGTQKGLAAPAQTPAATPAQNGAATPWNRAAAPSTLAAPKADPTATSAAGQRSLFELDDNAPVTIGGKPSTAGALKKTLIAQIAAKAGPPKTIKAGTRVLSADLIGGAGGVQSQPVRSGNGPAGFGNGLGKIGITNQTPAGLVTPAAPGMSQRATAKVNGGTAVMADLYCTDKGPPTITEVGGKLKPGTKVVLWGRCFGDRTGQVEVIGQFPGGKLTVAFTAWSQTEVDLQIPATVRGATDHTVAVTVVTTDGKRSPAMQAQFVASREHIEVPQNFWTPGANFELAATTDGGPGLFGAGPAVNPAAAGHLQRNLRVNPQCALESMVAEVISGNVTQIRGFEQGPPNEAAVTIDWMGTCIDTKTTTTTDYVITQSSSSTIKTACRVALQPRAWAYCPAGIAP